jgi:hypothetical protein
VHIEGGGLDDNECYGLYPFLGRAAVTKVPNLTFDKSKKLDSKFIQRLETAVAKSEYSQGKKLKVVPKVGDRTIQTVAADSLVLD